jgi:hypothetical protein
MAKQELEHYRYRGARALVLLHERHMRDFLETWRAAHGAGVKLPETTNPSYASHQAVLLHTLRAARGYLVWICEKLALPDPGIEEPPALEQVEGEAERYLGRLLERYRLPLGDVEAARFRESHVQRSGVPITIENMLEHAVLHPMRHAFQLQELLEAQTR